MQVNISARLRQDFLNMIQEEDTLRIARLDNGVKVLNVATANSEEKNLQLADVPVIEKVFDSAAPSMEANMVADIVVARMKKRLGSTGFRASLEGLFSIGKCSAMNKQLTALEKELMALIGKDILPRWKKKESEVDRFLRSEPCEMAAA